MGNYLLRILNINMDMNMNNNIDANKYENIDNNNDIILSKLDELYNISDITNNSLSIFHILIGSYTSNDTILLNNRHLFHEIPLLIERLLLNPIEQFSPKLINHIQQYNTFIINQYIFIIDPLYLENGISTDFQMNLRPSINNIIKNTNIQPISRIRNLNYEIQNSSNSIKIISKNQISNIIIYKNNANNAIQFKSNLHYYEFPFYININTLFKMINTWSLSHKSCIINYMDFTGYNSDINILNQFDLYNIHQINNNIYNIRSDCLMNVCEKNTLPIITLYDSTISWIKLTDCIQIHINLNINININNDYKIYEFESSYVETYYKFMIQSIQKIIIWMSQKNLDYIPFAYNNTDPLDNIIIPYMKLRCVSCIELPFIINYLYNLRNIDNTHINIINHVDIIRECPNITILNMIKLEKQKIIELIKLN